MAHSWRWLLILLALALCGTQVHAAGNTREKRAYAAAIGAFQDEMWGRAETELAQFVGKYPESTNVPEALLLEAQAQYEQGKLPQAIALLSDANNMARAKAAGLTDQYTLWIGEAQYAQNDFLKAAETFTNLAKDFPDSSLRLRAVVEAAAACTQLGDWQQHDALLEDTNGVFQRTAQLDPGNALVLDGQLSRENSQFQRANFQAAIAVYNLLTNEWQTLNQTQQWQATYLFYMANTNGDLPAALGITANLLQIAGSPTNQEWLATAWASRATVLERMNRLPEAIGAWQQNLINAPAEQQREATLKIAELAIAQNIFSDAEQKLENFTDQFPNSPVGDIALLTLGELHLKDYANSPAGDAATSHLREAVAAFDRLLSEFTNSPLTAAGYLDLGWCQWFLGDLPNSLTNFETAATMPLPPVELAVARFKVGDVCFALNDFARARDNYQAVVDNFNDLPAVEALKDRAYYQILRASLELNDERGASNALAQILAKYPSSDLAPNSALLYGEGLTASSQPAAARRVFQKFLTQWPDSTLRPQVEFALARTYELEQDWSATIAGYQAWLEHFPTNELRAQTIYSLALADAQAGNDTNAFSLFTNFVVQYTNDLTPLTQWWIAAYYYRLGGTNDVDAEKNFELVYQNFPANALANQARMMAGLSAVGLGDYNGAIHYFGTLEVDTNCPDQLRVQAAFAHGDALMRMDSSETNNPLYNFQLATNEFAQIYQLYPTNELGARAWGRIGDCDLQLTNYDEATNAYAQVLNPNLQAKISLRSQAQIGIGIVLKKKAALSTGSIRKALLEQALDNYLDVFATSFGKNLRDGETADPFWVKKAGLEALPLLETLGVSPPDNFIAQMETLLPQLKDSDVRATLPPPKN
jgi:TolA-binding protein